MTVATDAGAVARTPAQVAQDTILVLDFGSQYTPVDRASRARGQGVLRAGAEATSAPRRSAAAIRAGSSSAAARRRCSTPAHPTRTPRVYDLDIPILGICYGMDLLAVDLGGGVAPAERREYGHASVTVDEAVGLFAKLPRRARRLDVARRRRHRACHRASGPSRIRSTPPAQRSSDPASGTASSSTPRSRTRRSGATSCATSSSTSAGAPAPGRPRRSSR